MEGDDKHFGGTNLSTQLIVVYAAAAGTGHVALPWEYKDVHVCWNDDASSGRHRTNVMQQAPH
jgi:hypothetical protein